MNGRLRRVAACGGLRPAAACGNRSPHLRAPSARPQRVDDVVPL
jgi:hypothetical protein